MRYLLLAFIVIPFIELTLLMMIADRFNWHVALAFVVGTGIVGAVLVRWQGYQAVKRVGEQLEHHKMPTQALFDAAVIFMAGLLLMTPGVLTDFLGLALLIPWTRRLIFRPLIRRWSRESRTVFVHGSFVGPEAPQSADGIRSDRVLHVEVIERTPNGL